MKLKRVLSCIFMFLFVATLSGCFFKDNKPDVYAQSEIKGNNVLQSLTLNVDSANKTIKVKYGDYVSQDSKIKFSKSNKVFVRETKNEIGITSKYENEYYFYVIELSSDDNQAITTLIRNTIDASIEGKTETNQDAKNMETYTITGVGLYIERHLYNGKVSSTNDFYVACAILENGSYYYNGDSSYQLVMV